MLEKLLSLLLHAKSGAVATVLVLGASGALVTATVDDGVTTITITQPTEGSTTGSTTTTTNTTVEQAILALFTRTSAENDPTSTATGPGCSDEAHARNEQMKRVDDASKSHAAEVKDLGRGASGKDAKELVKDADKDVKEIRQLAVKAIHGTFDCDKDDEDEDQDEDEDENGDEDEDAPGDNTSSAGTLPDFTGDAEAIADLAIALMDQVVADLEEALADLEDSDEETGATNTKQNGKSDSNQSEKDKKANKGQGNSGNGKGRNR